MMLSLVSFRIAILEKRRQNPQDDFITRLIAAQTEDEALTDSDLLQLCVETTVCGVHETSMALIADGVYLLLSSGQFELLKENPELVSNVVEEVLRCHTPTALAPRIAKEELEVGGKTIKKGQLVFLNLAAANRDPEKFSKPERFDITRSGDKNNEI